MLVSTPTIDLRFYVRLEAIRVSPGANMRPTSTTAIPDYAPESQHILVQNSIYTLQYN